MPYQKIQNPEDKNQNARNRLLQRLVRRRLRLLRLEHPILNQLLDQPFKHAHRSE